MGSVAWNRFSIKNLQLIPCFFHLWGEVTWIPTSCLSLLIVNCASTYPMCTTCHVLQPVLQLLKSRKTHAVRCYRHIFAFFNLSTAKPCLLYWWKIELFGALREQNWLGRRQFCLNFCWSFSKGSSGMIELLPAFAINITFVCDK